jgi:hypothetical protein
MMEVTCITNNVQIKIVTVLKLVNSQVSPYAKKGTLRKKPDISASQILFQAQNVLFHTPEINSAYKCFCTSND